MNISNFIEKIEKTNKIGYREGNGITRLALSKEDIEARELIKKELEFLGMIVWEDSIGNIRARKEGENKNLPAVMCGSHIDTVPNGGKYDGLLGVLCGIEVVRMIVENEVKHEHPIEIIVFTTEESSRFNISTVGSKSIIGALDSSKLKTYVDNEGISLYEALVSCGFNPENMNKDIIIPTEIKAFLELHIEQGPILESENIDIGIVEGIAAPIRLKINLIGEESHSGSCPMGMRRDALTAGAEIILEVEKKGIEEAIYKTVATTGVCKVKPGAMNVVPGEVELFIDIRGIDLESNMRTLNYVADKTKEICEKRDLDYKIVVVSNERPISLKNNIKYLVKENCKKLNLSFKEMMSGAGHDCMNMAKVVPSSLIFIPCIGGISHNKKEAVKKSDLENGIKILYETIVKLANEFDVETY